MKCAHEQCSDVATHALRLSIPAKSWPIESHTPTRMMVGLKLCHLHACQVRPDELLGEELRMAIERMLAGRCPPDFERAFIDPIGLESPEFLQFEKLGARSH